MWREKAHSMGQNPLLWSDPFAAPDHVFHQISLKGAWSYKIPAGT